MEEASNGDLDMFRAVLSKLNGLSIDLASVEEACLFLRDAMHAAMDFHCRLV